MQTNALLLSYIMVFSCTIILHGGQFHNWFVIGIHNRSVDCNQSPQKLASIGTALANSVESDHRCTSRNYFDNAGDNVTLTLYSVTMTSQKP